MESTIDGDLLMCLEATLESVHICTDSDEIAIFEVSDDNMNTGLLGRKRTTKFEDLVVFASRACNRMHRKFVQVPIVFHSDGLERALSDVATWNSSEVFINRILVALCDLETTGKGSS